MNRSLRILILFSEVVFELINGYMCCTLRGDLIKIFKKLQKRRDRFDRIIKEKTGMADPAPVCQTFLPNQGLLAFAKIDAGPHTQLLLHAESRMRPDPADHFPSTIAVVVAKPILPHEEPLLGDCM